MSLLPGALLVFTVYLAGAFVHTLAGFGSALVAVPFVALAYGAQTAAPTQALISLVLLPLILRANWTGLNWQAALPSIAGMACGIPMGTWLLALKEERLVQGTLGGILLAFALFQWYTLSSSREVLPDAPPPELRLADAWKRPGAFMAGIIAGSLAGAYAIAGPPLIVYGVMQRWPKAAFKAWLQTCLLFGGWGITVSYAVSGFITGPVLLFALGGIPGALIGF